VKPVDKIPTPQHSGKYAELHEKIWDGQIWELTEEDFGGSNLRQAYSTLFKVRRHHGYSATICMRNGKVYVQRHDV
jgi:hypothetical protein